MGELADLVQAVVGHALPFGKPGQGRFENDTAAGHVAGFGQHHLVAALAQDMGGLKARRPRTHDQHA